MIANFIFHFIFAVFSIWTGVAWFMQNSRLNSLKYALVPLLSLDKIEFPKHRSLFVRGVKSLEIELTTLLNIKVTIHCIISDSSKYKPCIFRSFCLLFNKNFFIEEKFFIFENNSLTLNELITKIKNHSKTKKLNFKLNYINENNYSWQVETLDV